MRQGAARTSFGLHCRVMVAAERDFRRPYARAAAPKEAE
jgi:hypothetical protein